MKTETALRSFLLNQLSVFAYLTLFCFLLPGPVRAFDLVLLRVGVYDTSGWVYGLPVSANFVYVADSDEVWLLNDITDPTNPKQVGGYKTIASAFGIVVSGKYAYVAARDAGLNVIDVSNP